MSRTNNSHQAHPQNNRRAGISAALVLFSTCTSLLFNTATSDNSSLWTSLLQTSPELFKDNELQLSLFLLQPQSVWKVFQLLPFEVKMCSFIFLNLSFYFTISLLLSLLSKHLLNIQSYFPHSSPTPSFTWSSRPYKLPGLKRNRNSVDGLCSYLNVSFHKKSFHAASFKSKLKALKSPLAKYILRKYEKIHTLSDLKKVILHYSSNDVNLQCQVQLESIAELSTPTNTPTLRTFFLELSENQYLSFTDLHQVFHLHVILGHLASLAPLHGFLMKKLAQYEHQDFPIFCYHLSRTIHYPGKKPEITRNEIISHHIHALVERLTSFRPPSCPPRRQNDYRIQLVDNAHFDKPGPLPKYSVLDQKTLKEIVLQHVKDQIIEPVPQHDFYSVPLIVNKSHSTERRMIIDYRNLNQQTFSLPTTLAPFQELVADIGHPQVYSTLNLSNAYHNLRIHDDTKPYTVFKTPWGFYQFKVLPWGLSNLPEIFNRFIRNILGPFLSFCRSYLDDILIFSNSFEEHILHLEAVLSALQVNNLPLNQKKSVIGKCDVEWLGHTLSVKGIHPSSSSITTIQQISAPRCKKDIQYFLGHTGFLNDFIPNYSQITTPLTDLLRKDVNFNWNTECQEAFNKLKNDLNRQLTLNFFDRNLPTKISCDASNSAIGMALWQRNIYSNPLNDDSWYPISFKSQKLKPEQCRWSTIDKELYAVNIALKKFNFFVASIPIQLYTSYKPIVDIFNSTTVTPKQDRWLDDIKQYNISINYSPSKANPVVVHFPQP